MVTPETKLKGSDLNDIQSGEKDQEQKAHDSNNKIDNRLNNVDIKQFHEHMKPNSILKKSSNKRIRKMIMKKITKNDVKITNNHIRRNTTITSQIFEQILVSVISKKYYSIKSTFEKKNQHTLTAINPPRNHYGLQYMLGNSCEIKKASDFLDQIVEININEEIEENNISLNSCSELLEILHYYGWPKCYIQKGLQYLQYLIIIYHFNKIDPKTWNTNKKISHYMIILKNTLELSVNSFTSFHKFMYFIDQKFKSITFKDVIWKSLIARYKKNEMLKKAFVNFLNDDEIHNFLEMNAKEKNEEVYTIKSLIDSVLFHPQIFINKQLQILQIPPSKILKIIQKISFD